MDFDVFLLDGRWAGLRLGGRVSPRRATFFSCSHKKRRQKKCALLAATPQLMLRGNLCRGMDGVGRRTHFAPLALRSDSCGQSDHEAAASYGAAATPPSPRPRRIQKGVEVHTGHCFARPWGALTPALSQREREECPGGRMVVCLCLCPCLRLRLRFRFRFRLGLGSGVGWCWCWSDAGLIEREGWWMRHACCASPIHARLGPRWRSKAPRESSTSSTRTMVVDIPMNRPRSSSLSPWERAGVRAPPGRAKQWPESFPPSPLSVPRSAAGGVRGDTEGCPRFVI